MLGGLRGIDQRGVQHLLVFDFAGDFIGFLDDTVDRRTVHRLYLGTMHLEHLFQSLNMGLGLVEMGHKALF